MPRKERLDDQRRLQLTAALVLVLGLAVASIALASGGNKGHGRAASTSGRTWIGFHEVPAINTTGHARLKLTLTDTEIAFVCSGYAGLSRPPAAAHIHVGQFKRQRRRLGVLLWRRRPTGVPGRDVRHR